MAAFPFSLIAFAIAVLSLSRIVTCAPAPPLRPRSGPLPSYVTEFAPVVWLSSLETHQPSDIGAQLAHTQPKHKNQAAVEGVPAPLTLDNLDKLNAKEGTNVFLTSVDDITTDPSWLHGVKPDGNGKTNGATSCAVIVNDHDGHSVDAYYMYFYAYNWGGRFLGHNVDDHVGDWEHVMVRFLDGQPKAVWLSQHSFGEAISYEAVEKKGKRPVVYSANGSHANYPITGRHTQYGVDNHCDQGTLWDPVLNAYFYSYKDGTKSFEAYDKSYPIGWLNFEGRWGDEQYPDSDKRQHKLLGQKASLTFTTGPTGPKDKQLTRVEVCPTGKRCVVKQALDG